MKLIEFCSKQHLQINYSIFKWKIRLHLFTILERQQLRIQFYFKQPKKCVGLKSTLIETGKLFLFFYPSIYTYFLFFLIIVHLRNVKWQRFYNFHNEMQYGFQQLFVFWFFFLFHFTFFFIYLWISLLPNEPAECYSEHFIFFWRLIEYYCCYKILDYIQLHQFLRINVRKNVHETLLISLWKRQGKLIF